MDENGRDTTEQLKKNMDKKMHIAQNKLPCDKDDSENPYAANEGKTEKWNKKTDDDFRGLYNV